MPVLVEVCIDNPQSLRAAVEGGADRVELCSALGLGGLTPSPGFIELAAEFAIPVYAMIRPRDGNFEFDSDEITIMESDIRNCVDAGLDGVVVGATRDGSLDIATLTRLVDAAGRLGVTLHRAFDTIQDPMRAIDEALNLGIERILTSGGALKAEEGIPQISACVSYAEDQLSIMAGSGIDAKNVTRIIQQTGVREVHGTFARQSEKMDPQLVSLGFAAGCGPRTSDAGSIREINREIDGL